jgi:N-acyl-D-aspartate/D-glutamate deacylase
VSDLILSGGTFLDGTGAPARLAGASVARAPVVARGDLSGWRAKSALAAPGLHVAPGLVGIHAHSKLALLAGGHSASKVHQGVTSEISVPFGIAAMLLLCKAGWDQHVDGRQTEEQPGLVLRKQ